MRSADSLINAATPAHPATRRSPLCQNSRADRQSTERAHSSTLSLFSTEAQFFMTGAGVMHNVPWGPMLSAIRASATT